MSRPRHAEVSEYRQPWRSVDLCGRRCRLQILDPATAFTLEPRLVEVLGETFAFAVAAPHQLIGAVWANATANAHASDIRELIRDPEIGSEMAADAISTLASILAKCITDARLDGGWVRTVFDMMVLGRLSLDGVVIEDARDWAEAGMPWAAKWDAMGAQLRQTYGPLWTRSPYTRRTVVKDYGVPVPKGVPIAVRWADNLAKRGSASSSLEILTEWTPVRMIEIVENAAYESANEQMAYDEARAKR